MEASDAGGQSRRDPSLFGDDDLIQEGKQDDLLDILIAADAQVSPADQVPKALYDPDSQHEVYYEAFDKLKQSLIPSGEVGEPIRREINVFAKEGKDEGSDVRMARPEMLLEAVREIMHCVDTFGPDDLTSMLLHFRKLNVQWKADPSAPELPFDQDAP